MMRELQLICAMALTGATTAGSAIAADDPMWAPSGPDAIRALNQHTANEMGPKLAQSSYELGPKRAQSSYRLDMGNVYGPQSHIVGPPTPAPERAYSWPYLVPVMAVVFRTPADAGRCLSDNYARLKADYYDALPTTREYVNCPTYVNHSFKMIQFHGHAAYHGERTSRSLVPYAKYQPTTMGAWTEQQFINAGFKFVVGTVHDVVWVRGRTVMYCTHAADWAAVERFHTLICPHPSAGTTVAPPVTPPPSKNHRVFIDGQLMQTQTPPVELNSRVLVGMADIFRELGASVAWDGAQKKITATRGSQIVQLWIGRTSALVAGAAVALDVPPLILGGGSTYVPVRFVSQALGAGVRYDAPSRAVFITTASMPPLGGSPPSQTTVARLTVTSPANGASVPEKFTISGTGIPGKTVRVTVIAEATLKATGQPAKSRLLDNAAAKVGGNGRWSIQANSRAVRRDQRVTLKQFSISVQMPVDGRAVARANLIARP